MSVVKPTFYGHVRRTAFNLWRGPVYVENIEKEGDDHLLGGGCVLRLAIRKGETAKPMIESRAVYAILRPDEPPDPILRAMYWDNTAIIHTTHSTPIDTPFKIAAKFVPIPLVLLHQWISLLEHLQTTIQATSREDDSLPICSLRVETNAVKSLFEKTWQVVEGENADLNRAWQAIWLQMEQALQTTPPLTDIKESFPRVEVKPDVYDLQTYQPTLNVHLGSDLVISTRERDTEPDEKIEKLQPGNDPNPPRGFGRFPNMSPPMGNQTIKILHMALIVFRQRAETVRLSKQWEYQTMATFHTNITEIQAKMQGLLGQKAWGVALGHGSFVTMEFGQPVPPTKPKEAIHGQWHLWLYGCSWRLEQEERVIVASDDDRSKIEIAIQRIEGQTLLSFELQAPALDAVITFENDIVLRLFSNETEEMDSWMLFTPDKVITVGPAGQWSYEA